jgi:hypothetical protein
LESLYGRRFGRSNNTELRIWPINAAMLLATGFDSKKEIGAVWHQYGGVEKSLRPTSGRRQLLTGSETAIYGLLMDFDADRQLSGNDAKKICAFPTFQ